MEHKTELRLPNNVYSPALLSGLLREINNLENSFLQKSVNSNHEIHLSPLFSSFVEANQLDIQKQSDRESIKQYLTHTKKHAPVIHISFASDPTASFMQKLTAWFRTQVNPTVLITVGLQPAIGVGCIVRTTNKQFDFSLGEEFTKKRDQLISRFSLTSQETGAPVFMPVQSAPKEVGK
jgi:F0F1-type ATP synthase delta subunit